MNQSHVLTSLLLSYCVTDGMRPSKYESLVFQSAHIHFTRWLKIKMNELSFYERLWLIYGARLFQLVPVTLITLTHSRCSAGSTWGGRAAMNTSFCRWATHLWSYELPVCPAHLVAWLSAGKTRQTHYSSLSLSLSWVWISRPGRRHGALLV